MVGGVFGIGGGGCDGGCTVVIGEIDGNCNGRS